MSTGKGEWQGERALSQEQGMDTPSRQSLTHSCEQLGTVEGLLEFHLAMPWRKPG